MSHSMEQHMRALQYARANAVGRLLVAAKLAQGWSWKQLIAAARADMIPIAEQSVHRWSRGDCQPREPNRTRVIEWLEMKAGK